MLDDINSIRQLIQTNKHYLWGEPHQTQNDIHINRGFSLIAFDTLSRLTRARQSNNEEMEEVFRNIRLLSEETSACILILHHNSKRTEFNDGDDWRGAISQIAALDNWFDIKLDKSNPNGRLVNVKKFRGLTPEPFNYELIVDEDSASLKQSSYVEETNNVYTALQDDIVELLNSPGFQGSWFTVKQISTALHADNSVLFPEFEAFVRCIRNRLNYLCGIPNAPLRRTGGGRRNNKVEYTAVISEGVES